MKMGAYATVGVVGVAVLLAACGGGAERKAPSATAALRPAQSSPSGSSFIVPDAGPAAGKAAPAMPAPPFSALSANTVAYSPPPTEATVQSAVLLRAQVLLDRAGFSPGVIDARHGENVRQALAAFQEARGLPRDGTLNPATWAALQAVGGPSVVGRYIITQADLIGPFISGVPDGLVAQANLTALSYTSAAELIAERFHMDEDLLRAMNPGVNFDGAGQEILVANPARPALAANVARIEVDAGEKAIRAYDAAGVLLAFYPATIGSSEQPSPTGSMKVNGVARHPTYTYDPRRLDYARGKITRRLVVAAGPNNPVGAVWIDLSKPTYGIHGTPNPDVIGKSQSNGCVRLTNWDVLALALGVKPGVKVTFV